MVVPSENIVMKKKNEESDASDLEEFAHQLCHKYETRTDPVNPLPSSESASTGSTDGKLLFGGEFDRSPVSTSLPPMTTISTKDVNDISCAEENSFQHLSSRSNLSTQSSSSTIVQQLKTQEEMDSETDLDEQGSTFQMKVSEDSEELFSCWARKNLKKKKEDPDEGGKKNEEFDNEMPPDFQTVEEWEAYYGTVPPGGLDASIPILDNEFVLYYSTSASESSCSSSALPKEEQKMIDDDEEEVEGIVSAAEEEQKLRKMNFHIMKHDDKVEREAPSEKTPPDNRLPTDGYISSTVVDGVEIDHISHVYKKKGRRRIVHTKMLIGSSEWNYNRTLFQTDSNQYVQKTISEIDDKLKKINAETVFMSNIEKEMVQHIEKHKD